MSNSPRARDMLRGLRMGMRKLKVAVVDDDEPVRRALSRLLRAASLDACTYASGEAFLQSLATAHPDCVVLDLHMPGLNGLDIQKWLVRSRQQVPVVIITGYDEPEMQQECLAAGAAFCLRKPIDQGVLLDAIFQATRSSPSDLDQPN